VSDHETTLERGVPAGAGLNPGQLGVLLTSPYSEDLVETLKTLPRGDRWWDEEREGWWIAAAHEAFVIEAAIAHLGGVKVLGLEGESDCVIDRHGRTVQERLL